MERLALYMPSFVAFMEKSQGRRWNKWRIFCGLSVLISSRLTLEFVSVKGMTFCQMTFSYGQMHYLRPATLLIMLRLKYQVTIGIQFCEFLQCWGE